MFEYLYGTKQKHLSSLIEHTFAGDGAIVPLLWTEHCVECAAPLCYKTCSRYKKRSDGNCVRVVNGISPINNNGVLATKVEFRTWAKIETQLKARSITRNTYSSLYKNVSRWGSFFRSMASISPFTGLHKFIDQGWFSYRQKYINYRLRNAQAQNTLTLAGRVINEDHDTSIFVDVHTQSNLLFRESVAIPFGVTEFKVSIPPYEDPNEIYFLCLHPANAEEHVTLTFEKLDLVPTDITSGKKVKCVIWDLDNTLWNGVLIESNDVEAKKEFVDLIKHLDSCGIVNSIASKNNEEDVLPVLRKLGIEEYFVFKKINWDPKSVNIGKTIKQMNINPNTIVFVDDNPFERNEVSLSYPSVTCVDPTDLLEFVKCQRFNMVVTEDSRNRRATYKLLESLKAEEEQWEGNINDFLKSCQIKVHLSAATDKTIPRCYELLQRTNQLNSSGRRLSLEEVESFVHNQSEFDSYVLNSTDKFGDYGIVGFLMVDKRSEMPVVTDFVISCRVANKLIESSLINHLANKYGGRIEFYFKKTTKNGPMAKIITDLKMENVSSHADFDVYSCQHQADFPVVVDIDDNV